jgi:hypothetical protein
MILSKKTLEKLRDLINEGPENGGRDFYKSGPTLVAFFNSLGFNDSYGQGFPSRWIYTDEKLAAINGKPELDKCVLKLFSPVDYVGKFELLDKTISEFNEFLSFDGWIVVRNGKDITFKRVDDSYFVKVQEKKKDETPMESADDFLRKHFEEVSLDGLEIETFVYDVLKTRVEELHRCFSVNVPLAVIFHSGSILEGVLFGLAQKCPKEFNSCRAAPTKDEKTKPFHEWTLVNFIDVSFSLGFLKEDVKKFSHVLRDFRNYIHPYQQASSGFSPDENTAKICFQVLKAAIAQIKQKLSTTTNRV